MDKKEIKGEFVVQVLAADIRPAYRAVPALNEDGTPIWKLEPVDETPKQ
jgi:hypothetical protein